MGVDLRSMVRRAWRILASVETGVVLLLLVVILSALGSIVLQRPVTRPDEMQRAYTPQVLRALDALGLTDVFHSWWFLGLVFLVSACIVAASIDRLPGRWRYYSRPYTYPDENFRRGAHPQKSLAVGDREGEGDRGEEAILQAAERALQSRGFRPRRVERQGNLGVFAERHRISQLAVYIVHSSLLLIFFGTIVDGLWGWRGTLNLEEGQSSNMVTLHDGKTNTLPFSIRCESAGQEFYPDGSPKKLWSRLAIVKSGQELEKKEIVVNDPLLYSGVRFYQSNYGASGTVQRLMLTATAQDGAGGRRELGLALHDVAALDADTTVRFAEFFPDYAIRDEHVQRISSELRNAAAHLVVSSKKTGKDIDVWLPQQGGNGRAPWAFEATGLQMGHFTGLEVSHEPGQWGVWTGVMLMGVGLALVFYLVHMRFWVVPVRDSKSGELQLWIGGSANRNRFSFEQRFNDLVASIEGELREIAGS